MRKRLTILTLLVGCLFTALAAPAKSSNLWPFCERRVNDESCVMYCCSDWNCWEEPC